MDISDPTYQHQALDLRFNPTGGSWWILQIQPTTQGPDLPFNPTSGSWWILQILPTKQHSELSLNPTGGLGFGLWALIGKTTKDLKPKTKDQKP